MISANNVTLRIGKKALFEDVNIKFTEGNCYGLIGANGAGKSTFLKILTGQIEPSKGDVSITPGQRLSFLEQDHFKYDEYTALDTVIMGNERLYEIMKEKDAIYMKEDFSDEDGVRAAELEGEFAELGGWEAESEASQLLQNLNISEDLHYQTMSELANGDKVKVLLAKALFGKPDVLLLDEPTNGLDPIGIAEVRNFIKNLSVERGKTILISSHILSEISLLADDIGIIDHGILLEESSMEELEKKNRKYIQLQVSDIPKASLILERQFHVTDYAVQDEHNLRLYDTALDMAAINKALVVQDVAVISSQICNDTLEDYFKQITGGEGIA